MASRQPLPAWCRIVRESAPVYPAPDGAVSDGRIRSARDVFELLRVRAESEEQEVVYVVLLNSQARVLAAQEVTRGALNGSMVHPREVFRLAIAYGAASIVVAHNHPSGDPTPSPVDRATTRQLVEAGRIIGIPVYDHVVIGSGRFVSFSETGML